MRFPKHVSLATHWTMFMDWYPTVYSAHSAILLVPPAFAPITVPVFPYLEVPVPQAWPGGMILGKHNLTENVRHQGRTFALKGHDCGYAITHVCSYPLEAGLQVLHTLVSSRTAKFGAGEVKANNTPIGCCVMFDGSLLPTPMMICGGPPLPMAGTGYSNYDDLIVGMHWVDFAAGLAACLADAVVGIAMAVAPISNVFEDAAGEVLAELIDEGIGASLGFTDLFGYPGSVAEGLIHYAGQEYFDYYGDLVAPAAPLSGEPDRIRHGDDLSVTSLD